MESLNLLKQAALADSLGKFKLADSYYNKAIRLAGPGMSPLEKIIERAIIKGMDDKAMKMILEDVSKTTDKKIAELVEKGLTKVMAEELVKASAPERMIMYGLFSTVKVRPSAKLMDAILTAPKGFGKLIANSPTAVKIGAGGASLGSLLWGGYSWINRDGTEATENDVQSEIDKITGGSGGGSSDSNSSSNSESGSASESGGSASGSGGSGSGSAGAAEMPGPGNNWKYTSPEQMYELRMKAKLPGGESQQGLQGEKAQKFVTENKDKYKTQRAFYDAALAAGDKNFANSVIALVKKDLTLPIN